MKFIDFIVREEVVVQLLSAKRHVKVINFYNCSMFSVELGSRSIIGAKTGIIDERARFSWRKLCDINQKNVKRRLPSNKFGELRSVMSFID